jgi:hypothetical protein
MSVRTGKDLKKQENKIRSITTFCDKEKTKMKDWL